MIIERPGRIAKTQLCLSFSSSSSSFSFSIWWKEFEEEDEDDEESMAVVLQRPIKPQPFVDTSGRLQYNPIMPASINRDSLWNFCRRQQQS